MPSRTLIYYSVDAAVGPGKPNKPEDVMLLQYIFGVVWPNIRPSTYYVRLKSGKSVALKPMDVNGVADDNLFGHILLYQSKGAGSISQIGLGPLESLSQGGSDGVVDPVSGPRTAGAFSRHLMGALNTHLNAKIMDKFNNLPWDTSVPPVLREALRRNYK